MKSENFVPPSTLSPLWQQGPKEKKEKKEKYKHSLYIDEYGHILLLYFSQKQINITSNDQKYASALL